MCTKVKNDCSTDPNGDGDGSFGNGHANVMNTRLRYVDKHSWDLFTFCEVYFYLYIMHHIYAYI